MRGGLHRESIPISSFSFFPFICSDLPELASRCLLVLSDDTPELRPYAKPVLAGLVRQVPDAALPVAVRVNLAGVPEVRWVVPSPSHPPLL